METFEKTLWVNAVFDGRPVKAIVDTGAESTTLNFWDAKRLGLDQRAPDDLTLVGAANGARNVAPIYHISRVQVPGFDWRDVDVVVNVAGPTVPTLLGADLLGRQPVTVDFARGTVAPAGR